MRMDLGTQEHMMSAPPRFAQATPGPMQGLSHGQILIICRPLSSKLEPGILCRTAHYADCTLPEADKFNSYGG
jgi:hypothetical protein